MISILEQLNQRNPPLYYFGCLCLLAALACAALVFFTHMQVAGVNAWYKPLKFGLSIGLFAWTMAWYMQYLGSLRIVSLYSWVVVLLLGFEMVYIALQAGRGQLSHYNLCSPMYSLLTAAMAMAALAVTLGTACIGVIFWQQDFPALPAAFLWSIRIGLTLFVVFALLGGVMGARGSHTVGGPDGGSGLPLVHWSRRHGDLRIAHFMGMHALQILPLLSFYLVRNTTTMLLVGLLYGLVGSLLFIQAMQGRSIF